MTQHKTRHNCSKAIITTGSTQPDASIIEATRANPILFEKHHCSTPHIRFSRIHINLACAVFNVNVNLDTIAIAIDGDRELELQFGYATIARVK